MKKNKKALIYVLYGIAIILGLYTIFTMYNSYTYISSLVSQGLVISDEWQNVLSYFVGATAPNLFYTISVWGIGYIISRLNYIENELKTCCVEETIIVDCDEEAKIEYDEDRNDEA